MTHQIEFGGISVVAAGAFNPAIFHPLWLAEKDLMPREIVDATLEGDDEILATRQLAAFTAGWLTVQVTLEQAQFSTVEEGRELDLRDLVKSVWDLLPETPINAIGLNADAHFKVDSEEAWHAFGDLFLPKDFWQPLFDDEQWRRRENGLSVGMREMVVEAWRTDINGYVRTQLAPSVRVAPYGVYTGVNAHFQLSADEHRGTGYDAARIVDEQWAATRDLSRRLIHQILEAA
jgi:hypothetical protein